MSGTAVLAAAGAAARRELAYLRATPAAAVLSTLFPCAMLALLAWLLSDGVIRDLPIAVVDRDHSSLGRELIRRLDASPGLAVAGVLGDLEEGYSRVRRMDVYAVVLIPDQATKALHHDGQARLLVYYNASYLTAGQSAAREVAAVVGALGGRVLEREIAKQHGTAGLHAPPLSLQATTLANPERSFEHYLLGLLFPGVLHLTASLSMVGALGREIRDGCLQPWLADSPHPAASLAGKLAPYVVIYTLLSAASLAYLALLRGGGIAGSAAMLGAGVLGLHLASAGIALLLVGALRDMGTALSLTGLYVGTALAFSGATFPLNGAAPFAQVWNALLPLTRYLKLQAQQVDLGAPAADSLGQLAALGAFALVPGAIGIALLGRHARRATA